MTEKFLVIKDKLVPWPQVAAARRARASAIRSSLPSPMIISDNLDGVQNPCDGKIYDSKSAYYRAVKDAGCEIVGNEAEKLADATASSARPKVTQQEVVDAMHKVEAGYKPALEHDKEFDSWIP